MDWGMTNTRSIVEGGCRTESWRFNCGTGAWVAVCRVGRREAIDRVNLAEHRVTRLVNLKLTRGGGMERSR